MHPLPSPPPTSASPSPSEVLHSELRRLYRSAGEPSLRATAARTGGKISHDTVHRLLLRSSGHRMPRWPTLELVVTALGGDTRYFYDLWLATREAAETATENTRPNPRSAQEGQPDDGRLPTDQDWPEDSLLGRLRDVSRRELIELGTAVHYSADQEIIKQGATDTHLLLLLDGAVKIVIADETEDTAVLAVRTAGDTVGEMEAFDHKPRFASAVTCGDVAAKLITNGELMAFLHRRNDVFVEIAGVMNDSLRWAQRRQRDFQSHPAAERIARVLTELVQTNGREVAPGWILELPLTKAEIASMAAARPQTAVKAFKALRKAGVLVSHSKYDVLVPDLEALRKFAGL